MAAPKATSALLDRSLDDIITSAWQWDSTHLQGYTSSDF
jgi:hypothetical protein